MIKAAKWRAAIAGAVLRRRIGASRPDRRRARTVASRVLELAAYALFAAAGWRLSPSLGVAIAGLALLVLAAGVERPPEGP